jgi:nucleotide-binding universal stress UspA family protein
MMRILLALDGSSYSDVVTDALIVQANTQDVKVHILHVLEPFPERLAERMGSKRSPDFVAARTRLREQAEELMAQAVARVRSAGFEVASLVKEGDARDVILKHSETWRADLIMVGSHGRTGLDRFLMGSVSEAVARHAHCSVEIVRIHPAP